MAAGTDNFLFGFMRIFLLTQVLGCQIYMFFLFIAKTFGNLVKVIFSLILYNYILSLNKCFDVFATDSNHVIKSYIDAERDKKLMLGKNEKKYQKI